MTRQEIATHEAGHAVVAMALHVKVESVSIDGDDGRCVVSPRDRWSRCLIDLGGPLGERLVLGKAVATSPQDMRLFVAYPVAKQREACAVVLGILRRRIGLIEVIADELARKSRLDAKRLAELEADWCRGFTPWTGGFL